MRFRNPNPEHRRPSLWAVFRWGILDKLTGRRLIAPVGPPAPRVEPDLELIHANDAGPRLTWLGHASFLLRMEGMNLLIDPVFADRIGWFYPRQLAPGLTAEQLPPVDVLLVSHNHYDHLDLPSIEALPRSATVVTTRGLGRYFVKRLFARVIELDWWDTVEVGALRFTLTPARHWSRRTLFDTNRTLWGGFVIESVRDRHVGRTGSPSVMASDVAETDRRGANAAAIYYAGDSAWFDGFAEVGRRFPHLDLALIPIGGYEPAWFMENNHLNPEQAGQAFLDCGAQRMVPMHWGTFQMTDEPLSAPIERLRRWWDAAESPARRQLIVPAVGETIGLSNARASGFTDDHRRLAVAGVTDPGGSASTE
jgi:L-ascorbate metabolism protein UlaG (beta-lactamase superfamily)